jgi:hypothetical protein
MLNKCYLLLFYWKREKAVHIGHCRFEDKVCGIALLLQIAKMVPIHLQLVDNISKSILFLRKIVEAF